MTIFPPPPTTYSYGLEHSVVPPGPAELPTEQNWETVTMDFDDTTALLEGFRIYSRAYIEDDVTLERTYPNWEIISQTLEKIDPTHQVFTTNTGTELFTSPPNVLLGVSEAGITDGTEYDYFGVFDETEFDWLPRNASNNQFFISNKRAPNDPYDESRPRVKYPIDTVNKLVPDQREIVTITYKLTTTYRQAIILGGGEIVVTDELIVKQDVRQPMEDWGARLKAVLKRTAYYNGYYHMSLYPVDENSNYNSVGNPRGAYQIEVYDVENNLVSTECFNDKDNRVSSIIEPVYPITAKGELVIVNGECVDVNILHRGAYYPHNFYVRVKDVTYNTRMEGGTPPLIKVHVTPIARTPPQLIDEILYLGHLVGGEVERFEIVDPGENLDPDNPPVIDLESYDLSNTVVNYSNLFSYNKLETTPIVQPDERLPDDD